jgi:hypothetical protein
MSARWEHASHPLAWVRERARAKRREARRRAIEVALVDVVTHLQLDRELVRGLSGVPAADGALGIRRVPLAAGRGSHQVNHVRLRSGGGRPVDLVEKVVNSDGTEMRFWAWAADRQLTFRGDGFELLHPELTVTGRDVSALYFRYIPELARERAALKRAYRGQLRTIASAVGHLNASNVIPTSTPPPDRPRPFPAQPPAPTALERHLGVTAAYAQSLRAAWNALHRRWDEVEAVRARLPRVLCHHDVSPGNVAVVAGETKLIDPGLSDVGPLGSDLHAVLRWSGPRLYDDVHSEQLLAAYLDGVRAHLPTVDADAVRVTAWATFFLRYTNLRFGHARDLAAFELAIRRLEQLLGPSR